MGLSSWRFHVERGTRRQGAGRKIDWLRFFLFRSSRTNFMQVLWKHSREKFVWSLGVRLSGGISRVVTEIGFSCCQSGGFCWNGRQPGRLECWEVRSVIREALSLRKFIRRCWKMKTEARNGFWGQCFVTLFKWRHQSFDADFDTHHDIKNLLKSSLKRDRQSSQCDSLAKKINWMPKVWKS